jgi:EAL domain-containing protein (putative c-di-GMP-specific phosphodiesterase class I)/anti-sigma regulatory factor (Ser/Thr protein kinase)
VQRTRRPDSDRVRSIRRGIDADEFELHYQPQVDIQHGLACGVEALLRWRHGGVLLAPSEFLAEAEASWVIRPLTDHVLDIALAQAAAWERDGRPIPVAVNLSASNLTDFSVVESLERLLVGHNVPPSRLTLEVTETAVLEKPETARAVIDAIAALGVAISVDDFGTGYASLLWLRLFEVSQVKIDRTFVSTVDRESEVYVAGAIRLAHDLGLTVVAEGIEDVETLQVMQELGCDIGQGYYFAKPLPAPAIPAWLESGVTRAWTAQRTEIVVDSDAAGLDAARALIERTASEVGFDEGAIWEMKLATTEALTNAIDHGEPADGGVHLSVRQERDHMVFEVWGGASAPSALQHVDGDPRNRGRGIAMMSALMDGVELRQHDGTTRIRLAKRRRPGEAPALNA